MEWIAELRILERIEEKLWQKHRVSMYEVEEVLLDVDPAPYAERGREGLWLIYGRTDAGRYLLVVLADHGGGVAWVVTAREMTDAERNRYRRRVR